MFFSVVPVGRDKGILFHPCFFFVMEALSQMISAVISGGLLEGFKIGNATFSHLLFADDILFFCSAHSSHALFVESLPSIRGCIGLEG